VALPIPAFARRLLRPAWERRHWEKLWRSGERPYWVVDEPRPAVVAAARDGWFPRGETILDVGCGTGGNAAWLAAEGFPVLATDISASAVALAAGRHASVPRLSFAVLDACGPDRLGRTFRAILDSGCLHIVPVELRPRYRDNILAWSAPGTRYLLRMGDDVYTPEEAQGVARALFGGTFDFESVTLSPRTTRIDDPRRSIVFRLIRR
jgi:SAM-dependent methyltransferase